MKKVEIKNKDGVVTNRVILENPTMWIADCVASNVWGLPERPELDAEGNPTGNTLPADYTVEITDISAEYALMECISKRKAEYPSAEEFLNAFFDGGEAALAELQAKRLLVKAKYPKPSQGEE
jgi:hypothetical protein